ncbi:glycosyltransferase family 4 protein [Vibrio anguillarum]|uniref:glycosyltransferase family 4 protein n=1 Tax=Vibrio anguillarum TaxID=55601 RepID=UPI0018FE4764|nr:glycosyltransferase family 4 protein [Vibrio anguillarum]MCC4237776.1 glycosyltransferase family 4 protein [Vibrio anguillarum]
MPKKRIAFIHNNCKDFRHPVFSNLDSNEDFDIDFYLLDEPVKPLNKYNVLKSIRIPLMQDFIIPFGLWAKLKSKEYDYVVSTDLGYVITYIGFLYSLLYNSKFILWNEQWQQIQHPRRYLTRFFEKIICKKSHKILAFGHKHEIFALSMGASKDRIIHVPNVVPHNHEKVLEKDYIEFKENEKYILCLARLIKIKGHKSLIKAFSKVVKEKPNYRLIIAGSGIEYSSLKKLIDEYKLQDKVYMPNRVVIPEEKFKLMRESEIVILPSIKTRTVEAWGLVVNEAALLKKTIIVSSSTGVEGDIVKDSISGYVFEQNNEVELKNKILMSINEPQRSLEYANNAYSLIIDYYNLDVLNEKLKACFYD